MLPKTDLRPAREDLVTAMRHAADTAREETVFWIAGAWRGPLRRPHRTSFVPRWDPMCRVVGAAWPVERQLLFPPLGGLPNPLRATPAHALDPPRKDQGAVPAGRAEVPRP